MDESMDPGSGRIRARERRVAGRARGSTDHLAAARLRTVLLLGALAPVTLGLAPVQAAIPSALAGSRDGTQPSGPPVPARTAADSALGVAGGAVVEQPVVEIPLAGDVALRSAEISGLAWYGDHLIVLPQFPHSFPLDAHGTIFAIPRRAILDFLDGRLPGPVPSRTVAFVAPGLPQRIAGYDGLEAIAFAGDRAFLLVETEHADGMRGVLLGGVMAPDLSALTVDVTNPVPIPSRVELVNMSDEAMVVAGGEVYTFHEINGPAVNPDPVAHRFSADLQLLGTVTCPALEYRITDATEVDADGRFWVVNYFYPGDRELIRPGPDALRQRDGAGPTHRRCQAVERLVEFQLRGGEVICTDTPVIQLQLLGDEQCRNWEGVVRLDGRGFLLVTDEYPRTILAFVPAP